MRQALSPIAEPGCEPLRREAESVLKNIAGVKIEREIQQRCRRHKQRYEDQALDEVAPRNPARPFAEDHGDAGAPEEKVDAIETRVPRK